MTTFSPKDFIRIEWDGCDLTCYGRRGNGLEEPWGSHEFVKNSETRKWFDAFETILKEANIGPFMTTMGDNDNLPAVIELQRELDAVKQKYCTDVSREGCRLYGKGTRCSWNTRRKVCENNWPSDVDRLYPKGEYQLFEWEWETEE